MNYISIISTGLLIWVLLLFSCTHDPTFDFDPEPDPMDTLTTGIDTMSIDTSSVITPCDSTIVYFDNEVLPIFIGSCAYVGCHDASTASDGVILDGYDNIIQTGDIKPFDINDSDVYEVLTETDPDKIMPPSGPLDPDQINLIADWIRQGATNVNCDQEEEPCNTELISYSGYVVDIMQTYCNGCHASGVASGGIVTDTYSDIKIIADDGRLYGSLNWSQGYKEMPQGQDQLELCVINKIKSWIDDGAQDN